MLRSALWLGVLALALAGCMGLPAPDGLARSHPGEAAPAFTLARTGPTPGRASLADLTSGTVAVLVFYRGHW